MNFAGATTQVVPGAAHHRVQHMAKRTLSGPRPKRSSIFM